MKLLILLSVACASQPWSGIISTARAFDWSGAGVTGGIPSSTWTQCGSTISAYSGTAATINNAITACGTNQYVLLSAGTFTLSGGITMKSNTVLRGAGADQTLIVFTSDISCAGAFPTVCFGPGNSTNYFGDAKMQPGGTNAATWTSGYTQGSNQIVLSSIGSSGISVGQWIMLDQAEETTPNSGFFVCSSEANNCSIDGGNGDPGRIVGGIARQQVEMVQVTACSPCTSGSTFTISPPLKSPNWISGNSPGAWWPSTSAIISNAGLENLSIDASGSGSHANVTMYNAVNCWVTGTRQVRDIAGGSGNQFIISLTPASHITIANNYFYGTQGQSINYGIMLYIVADVLAYNNIFQHTVVPIMQHTSTGSVFSYNYAINDTYDDGSLHQLSTIIAGHSAGVMYNLYEGNIGPGLGFDGFHGNQLMNTSFRNYWLGWDPGRTNGLNAIFMDSYNRYQNVIGNVLGKSGVQTGYVTGVKIYALGEARSNLAADSLVATTLMRWGNWDVITNATRWCGNSSDTGWATTCSSTSEVPTGLSDYPNTVPSAETLPSSFYLSSRPSWWPSAKAWPPIGPDVTGGNISNLAGHVYTIPAQDCYLNVMSGPSDGTGAVLTFNATACYAQSPGTPVSTSGAVVRTGKTQ